jgi:transposase InsO family protein
VKAAAIRTAPGLSTERMLELGRVSRSSFYRLDGAATPGPDPDMDLRDAIQRIAVEWPSYGRRRITAALRRRGWTVNPKRVYRLMREDNLLCVRRRKFVVTTDSNQRPSGLTVSTPSTGGGTPPIGVSLTTMLRSNSSDSISRTARCVWWHCSETAGTKVRRVSQP